MTKKSKEVQPSRKANYCKYCNKTILGGTFNFKSHLYSHKAVKPRFNCKYCDQSYFRFDLYSRHLNRHEDIAKPKKVYVCDYCNRGFMDKRNLVAHLRKHDATVTAFRVTCDACSKHFSEKRILLNHIRRHHFNQGINKEPLHVNRLVNESWFEVVDKTDVYVQMTKVHKNAISIKKLGTVKTEKYTDFKTTDPKKLNSRKKLNGSLETDNYTLYSKAICDYCNKEMMKKSIQNHIRERHLNIRRFNCDKCKRTFKRKYQATRHICEKPRRGINKSVIPSELKVGLKLRPARKIPKIEL